MLSISLFSTTITPFLNPTNFPSMRFSNIGVLLNILIPAFTAIASILFLVMLVYGAFTILTASGDPANYAKARKIVTFAVIGLVTIVVAYLITKVIGIIFNVEIPI